MEDQKLFISCIREAISYSISDTRNPNKENMLEFVNNIATDYEIVHLAVNGKFPKYNTVNENLSREVYIKREIGLLIQYIENQKSQLRSHKKHGRDSEALAAEKRIRWEEEKLKDRRRELKKYQSATKDSSQFVSTAAGTATGIIAAGAILAIAYGIYKKYQKSAKAACKSKSGEEKEKCIQQFKVKGIQAQISKLQHSRDQCAKSNDPKKCEAVIDKKLNDLRSKMSKIRNR